MKVKLLIVSIILLSFTTKKDIEPIGTVKCNGVYIDKYETTISDYKEFLNFISSDAFFSQDYIQNAQLDSSLNIIYSGPHRKEELITPIVGITTLQANEYCKWRSEMVTFAVNYPDFVPQCRGKKCDIPPTYTEILEKNKEAKTVIVYRIPTQEELEITKNRIKKRNKSLKLLTQGPINIIENVGLRCVAEIELNHDINPN
ncbi:SUMF1/EgtB/PvdO family nonheme iron enzyme [Plebeiibacterium marinum]|uniref:Formylglycine-generating enzyme family protein n=1 Tax=Plebeiibacterium marinum TaxID=2992111 RepID=A0AAE3SLE5_9BACT|nr:SUMF1/EgtB/PvdO family nonheme iron enzyme [Plebeiobacterium marinum]MCW3807622.1 formylglycine-generating enzyme family protein [Plebeiobacterium marinum]